MEKNKTLPVKDGKGGNRKKLLIIITVIMAVIIALLGTAVILIYNGFFEKPVIDSPSYMGEDGRLKYDDKAVILDPGGNGEGIGSIGDGYISISHKNKAISHDGINFECYIQNGIENKYDMFINIYKDNTAKEQLLLTGLIPPGQGIDHFKSEVRLKPGDYDALLVITQVEDDRKTLRDRQLFLALHLTVG